MNRIPPFNFGFFAGKLNAFYNKKGIFDNRADGLAELREILHREFTDVELEVQGRVALFKGVARA